MEYGGLTACRAAVGEGIARCRAMARPGSHGCFNHPSGFPKAPRPEVVLLKVNLGRRWAEDVERVFGDEVPLLERSPERAARLASEHEAVATSLRRNFMALRREVGDSGSPVFGPSGLERVSLLGLRQELGRAGFVLSGVHRLLRHRKVMRNGSETSQPIYPVVLVMEFSGYAAPISFPWNLYRQLVEEATFGRVFVWANPMALDGAVVHTVNATERGPVNPLWELRYDEGDWMACT